MRKRVFTLVATVFIVAFLCPVPAIAQAAAEAVAGQGDWTAFIMAVVLGLAGIAQAVNVMFPDSALSPWLAKLIKFSSFSFGNGANDPAKN